VTLSTDEYHVHEVATVLKRFLRTLTDALLTSSLYDRWISASRTTHVISFWCYHTINVTVQDLVT